MNYNLVDDGYTADEIEQKIEQKLRWAWFGLWFAICCPSLITAVLLIFYANQAVKLIEHYEVGEQHFRIATILQNVGWAIIIAQHLLLFFTLRLLLN